MDHFTTEAAWERPVTMGWDVLAESHEGLGGLKAWFGKSAGIMGTPGAQIMFDSYHGWLLYFLSNQWLGEKMGKVDFSPSNV